MADEENSSVPSELETPAIAEAVPEPAPEEPERILEPGEEPDPVEGESEPPALDVVEIERNGRKYQVPKDLEGEFLMQADYTKKTQSVSERQKALESREAEINQRHEATEAELDARANLRTIEAQLAEFAKLTPQDWSAHMQNDPLGTQQARMHYDFLKDQKATLEQTVAKANTERTEKAQQDLAKRIQDTLAEAPKIIPGWKPETASATIQKLVEFAHSEGVPEQVLKANWGPVFLKLLHRAQVGTIALQKQAAPKPIPQLVAPLETVGGKSTPAASSSLADLAKANNMEAFANKFNASMAKRAGR